MLNTKKLLYILSDVAYVAELLPGKKEHTFSIQAFRQINGEFINEEEELIPDNIDKLLSKIEAETYHLVLPDFLFTNTIIEVNDTNENKVKDYIKQDLLPKLEITKDSHEIETFSLTQYNGVTKIQLTAIEKSVLDPLVVSANAHHINVEHISPLTWTIKAVISLEPSISVLQIGTMLYVAEHYIGVDQCTFSKVDEIENVVDTIKTLKGAQPSIQTVYLLTNQLVEEKLKDQVSSTLPIQQLASFKDQDEQMPSYVKQIIESGMRTLDIADFPVPSFALPKHPQGDVKVTTSSADDDEIEDVESPVLVPPKAPDQKVVEEDEETETDIDGEEEDTSDSEKKTSVLPPKSSTAAGAAVAALTTAPAVQAASDALETGAKENSMTDANVTELSDEPKTAVPEPTGSSVVADDSTIAKLAGHPEPMVDPDADQAAEEIEEKATPTAPPTRPVIKNKGEGGNVMKMVFVSLTVFALTVAVGIGIGYGVLSLNKNTEGEVAGPVTTPSPSGTPVPIISPTPSAVASASATIDKKTYKILVVNATTTPGYAGTTSTKLKAAGYANVTAKNALGDYEPGFYILTTKEDAAITKTMSDVTTLDLEFDSGKTTEDPSNQYDAVIVLAK